MIFLAGISATGKTRAASQLAASGKFIHVRASQLLVKAGCPIAQLTKAQAVQNQKKLLEILDVRPRNSKVVLDGHATIETVEGMIDVPDWFFDQANVQKIICLVDSPENIVERRRIRGDSANRKDVNDAQQREAFAAKRQAERLRVDYREITAGDSEAFRRAIAE
jgi:adenylate kinase